MVRRRRCVMASLRKIAIAVTAGVWASALGSAVALAYVLHGPAEPFPEPLTAHASVGHLHGAAPTGEALVEAPASVRVVPARHVLPSKPPPEPSVVDIEDMKCDDWRELQVGHGQVMVCEPYRVR
jgi:hypothetical protein